MDSLNILEIRDLKKNFADDFVIDIPELDIPSGAIVGMIGENGAGKTSVLRIIMNIYGRKSGSIKGFGGIDNVSDEAKF